MDDLIRDSFEVDGPRWSQKFYVAYRIGNFNWLRVETRARTLILFFLVKASAFDESDLAQRLGIEVFDRDETLAEKLGLPSSLLIQNRSDTTDRIILRLKQEFDLESSAFLDFLGEAHDAFARQ